MDNNLLRARRAALAQAIKNARIQQNMTQAEVSEQIGVPQSWVSNVESGVRRLDAAELVTISAVLNVPASFLIDTMKAADIK